VTPEHAGAISRSCEALVYRAAKYTDQRSWEELAALFAEQGKLARPSDPANPLVGRPAILASLLLRPPGTTRHLLNNVLVDVHSAETAHISSVVTLFSGPARSSPLPAKAEKVLIGNLEDDVVLAPTGWVFLSRGGSLALEWDGRAAGTLSV
jgi:hypothetical protein